MTEILNSHPWTLWKPLPAPEVCRSIEGPEGPGVYQIRHSATNEYVQFGIGKACRKRMKSLFPKPYGVGTRNNEGKRNYILKNWQQLEYRTLSTRTREEAKEIENQIKALQIHLFNT
ncbi:hypothetical protein [uncultured Salegentibacter sp.]|uniref:hypothetical protein n=1 Tax=uncultured Salegentibacter sp. TaxID=259320 RepID=UPI0025933FB8|nr:hypothetical protein [uncultured Salegentibacter sp.]